MIKIFFILSFFFFNKKKGLNNSLLILLLSLSKNVKNFNLYLCANIIEGHFTS